jgi:hypothetical protein
MRTRTLVLFMTMFALMFSGAVPAWCQAAKDLPAAPSASRTQEAPLTAGEKFEHFAKNSINPYQIVFAATRAGISQAADTNSGYGQGGEGYAKRFGAAMADEASSEFFGTFLYPVIFRQDPRYFRQGTGGAGSRIGYAVSRVFVTRGDNGNRQFNVSKILGCFSSAALSNAYYPDDERTVGKTFERAGVNLASTAGFNIFKEFLPHLAHKVGK